VGYKVNGVKLVKPVSEDVILRMKARRAERARMRRLNKRIANNDTSHNRRVASALKVKQNIAIILHRYLVLKQGSTTIAKSLGVSDWLIKKTLRRQGVAVRGPGKVAATECKDCLALGKSVPAVFNGRCKRHKAIYHARLNREWSRKKYNVPKEKWLYKGL
jgi:hypothetical protein